jgi:hypothetical protein
VQDWLLSAVSMISISPIVTKSLVQFLHFLKEFTLKLRQCTRPTDEDLAHLGLVHTLDISDCDQITDAGLAYLGRVHTLRVFGCCGITRVVWRCLAFVAEGQSLQLVNLLVFLGTYVCELSVSLRSFCWEFSPRNSPD